MAIIEQWAKAVVLNIAACAAEYGVAVGWWGCGHFPIKSSHLSLRIKVPRNFCGMFESGNWSELDGIGHDASFFSWWTRWLSGSRSPWSPMDPDVIGCQWELAESLRWQQLKPRMLGFWLERDYLTATLSETNIAMESSNPLKISFPMENGDIPLLG